MTPLQQLEVQHALLIIQLEENEALQEEIKLKIFIETYRFKKGDTVQWYDRVGKKDYTGVVECIYFGDIDYVAVKPQKQNYYIYIYNDFDKVTVIKKK